MKALWMAAGLACALALAGCGSGNTSDSAKTAGPSASAPLATAMPDLENGATIAGKVIFAGTPPPARVIDMAAVPACVNANKGGPPKSEEVVVNPNGTLKNAFVWVKSGLPEGTKWQVPAASVELNQSGCLYSPRVIGAMVGQTVDIKNSDPVNHNIHPVPAKNQEYNQSQPPGAGDVSHTFAVEEVLIPIKCNVHPWMRAYIGVVSHPFFAVTGDDGSYSLKGLPPGTYTVEMVHEKYGTQDQQVTVGAKESKAQDFTVKE